MTKAILDKINDFVESGELLVGKRNPETVSIFEKQTQPKLPAEYLSFLKRFNGIITVDGYFRLFGVGPHAEIDVVRWNSPVTWKDAWHETVKNYWCFGETAWGDQYSFNLGENQGAVYFLDSITMRSEKIADNFDAFLDSEFIRNIKDPYDAYLKRAQQMIGRLDAHEHITYVPSILITGSEDESDIQKMPAAASMVINGDLAQQLGSESVEREIRSIDFKKDSEGRQRAKVIWAA